MRTIVSWSIGCVLVGAVAAPSSADFTPVAQARTILARGWSNQSPNVVVETNSYAAPDSGPPAQTSVSAGPGGFAHGEATTTQDSSLGLTSITATGGTNVTGFSPSSTISQDTARGDSAFSYTFMITSAGDFACVALWRPRAL
jgi:hypothetical protein